MTSTGSHGLAIVTGGASGIGLATTVVLLAAGWKVCVLDNSAKSIDAARSQLQADAASLHFAKADVTDENEIDRLVGEACDRLGPVRGVVTSAGIARVMPFLETTPAMFRSIHEVNVIGTFNVCQSAARRMKDTGGGAIVTVASVSGLAGNMERSAYGSSKGAVVNLTRIMAVELGPYGIRVNCIAPGPIDTPMVEAMHQGESRRLWVERSLLGRYGKPEEIGEVAAFLLDARRASYVTGQILAVDGGFMAGGVIG